MNEIAAGTIRMMLQRIISASRDIFLKTVISDPIFISENNMYR